jgi:hypothetical protein
MKLTNKHGLPETFMNVLRRPTYSKGGAHLSATQLINSPKIVALSKKFDDEIEQDVADMVWSIFGTAVHNVLEHGADDYHSAEKRIHAEIDGWHISGAIDLVIKRGEIITISDYKTTSAWAVMNEKKDWEDQLNIYAWLFDKENQSIKVAVDALSIVAIIRDWNRRDAKTKEGYPQAPVKEIPIKLWTFEEREQFILDRIAAHSACEFAMETEGDLPDCTPEEMWEKPAVWAIRKVGGVRAKSLHGTEEEAIGMLEELGKGYEMEHRPGERTRCENFCQVNTYCQQYRDYLSNKGEVK